MSCFVLMLMALMAARTVNLTKLACFFASDSKISSRYRRMQRFFTQFSIGYAAVAKLVLKLFNLEQAPLYLAIDRTNWKWGKSNINILMLAIVYKGTAIPLLWRLLDKKGNSNTKERIELMEIFVSVFGKERIAGLLADREFVGDKWFGWLKKEKIDFYIRVKKSELSSNSRNESIKIDRLFWDLKCGEQRTLKDKRTLWSHKVYLSGLSLEDGEMLIIASNVDTDQHIIIYKKRWEIETLFSCLKGRGFNFEETHITDQEKIKKMLVLLTIAFCWAHKTGEWRHENLDEIKVKKHGRASVSFFRYGLDFICNALAKVESFCVLFKQCLLCIKMVSPPNILPTGIKI